MGDSRAENPLIDIAVGAILVVIAFVIAFAVLPTLNSSIAVYCADANTTATQCTISELIPLVVIVGLLGGGVAFLVRGFGSIRNAGP